MQVIVKHSFSDFHHGSYAAGQVIELPEGADWLKAGLVAEVAPEPEPEPVKAPKRRKKASSG